MKKNFFRYATLIFTFVLGGFFLNSCSNLDLDKTGDNATEKLATISFAISGSASDFEARTALPNSDDHDLKKYLYLYNYTLTCINENGEDVEGEEIIICNDFSYDKFIEESTIRLATKHKYRFNLKAKDGEVIKMEGSSIIDLGTDPSPQTVTIVLVPYGGETGQKLRVDWIVPDDGVIETMKAGISSERGHAELQNYAFSIVKNKNPETNEPLVDGYGETIKRIGLTFDDVVTGEARWLDYKFYDAKGILVYESSESIYMIGGKTSSAKIYITPDHYYRRPVTISVNKDSVLWADSDLDVKLVDKDNENIFYIFKPVLDEHNKPTGKYKGLLPGASSENGTTVTEGVFDIYVSLETNETSEDDVFIKTGAEYNANKGTLKGNGSTKSVELVTIAVPQKRITLTPTEGVVFVDGTPGDKSGNGSLIVPAGQDFTVQVNLEIGYAAVNGSTITVGGKTVSNGGTVTLNADDVSGEITVDGVEAIEYTIVYKSDDKSIVFLDSSTVTAKFTIEVEGKEDIELPKETNFADGFTKGDKKIGGWWFGNESEGNIIHKLNAEKSVREKLIETAVNNEVILNVYWIPVTDVEYKLVYKFEDLGSVPVTYSEDKNIISFHNVSITRDVATEIEIPQVPGFTAVEIDTDGDIVKPETSGFTTITLDGIPDAEKEYITKEIHYERNEVTITLWKDAETVLTSFSGKYGKAHGHVDDPVLENHRFLGWYVKDDPTKTPINHVDNHTFPATDMNYVAKWEQTHATYTVEYYYENEDSTDYVKAEEETRTPLGIIGAFPAFDTTPKAGFTYNAAKREITAGEYETSAIQADEEGNGITLVKLYFDRKTVTFTLKANGGKFTDKNGNITDEIILEGKYGAPLGYPRDFLPQSPVLEEHAINDGTAVANDFTFQGWHVKTGAALADKLPAEPSESTVATFPSENSIYAARWTPNNGIYTVVHWAESMDKYEDNGEYKYLAPKAIDGFSGQMLEGSVTKKGKIGSPMVYYHDEVTGFKTPVVEIRNSSGNITANADSGKITADAKTEVIVTYSRNEYTVNFHLNAGGDENAKWCGVDAGSGNSEIVPRTGKYRIDFDAPDNPVREHFVFRGWVTDPAGTLEDLVDVVSSFKENIPTDYYAVWYSKASGGLETDTSDIGLSHSVNGTEIVANVSIPDTTGEWTYSWSVNNIPVAETGKVLTLSDCLKKDYEITVVATHNGKVYTKTIIVTVK